MQRLSLQRRRLCRRAQRIQTHRNNNSFSSKRYQTHVLATYSQRQDARHTLLPSATRHLSTSGITDDHTKDAHNECKHTATLEAANERKVDDAAGIDIGNDSDDRGDRGDSGDSGDAVGDPFAQNLTFLKPTQYSELDALYGGDEDDADMDALEKHFVNGISVCVAATGAQHKERAVALAGELQLPFLDGPVVRGVDIVVVVDEESTPLTLMQPKQKLKQLNINFLKQARELSKLASVNKRNKRSTPLQKAIYYRSLPSSLSSTSSTSSTSSMSSMPSSIMSPPPKVLDISVDYGQAAMELAHAGCDVSMLRGSSITHAMIRSGLEHTRQFWEEIDSHHPKARRTMKKDYTAVRRLSLVPCTSTHAQQENQMPLEYLRDRLFAPSDIVDGSGKDYSNDDMNNQGDVVDGNDCSRTKRDSDDRNSVHTDDSAHALHNEGKDEQLSNRVEQDHPASVSSPSPSPSPSLKTSRPDIIFINMELNRHKFKGGKTATSRLFNTWKYMKLLNTPVSLDELDTTIEYAQAVASSHVIVQSPRRSRFGARACDKVFKTRDHVYEVYLAHDAHDADDNADTAGKL